MRYALILCLVLAGCATQRYGRIPEVGPTERASLSCDQIQVERGKAVDFKIATQREKDEVTGSDVLGFLGDFGFGNAMEFDAAMKSADDRIAQLDALWREKGCTY